MSPSDNSFTDNMSAVNRVYATHAGVATPDEDGNVSVDHIDGEEDTSGEPIDLAARDAVPSSRGAELTAEEQARLGETQPGADEDGFGGDAPEPAGGHPEVTGETDPDELSEAELEAATAPEGEEQA